MVTGLNHVSIAVPDIDAAALELREKYGLQVGKPMVNAEQGVRLAYVELGVARIELIAPSRPDSPIAKFLERNPKGGIHHFCLGVDDVAETTRGFAQNGVRVLGGGKPQHNVAGERIAFLHPGDFLGALVEIEEHKSRGE
jgi:methylmalonyl-CoA/ethylmalonyl-CoA epimerase